MSKIKFYPSCGRINIKSSDWMTWKYPVQSSVSFNIQVALAKLFTVDEIGQLDCTK